MRIFYAVDIHGSEVCFRKFLNAGKFYEAEVLILGGDLTAKMVVPIVHRTNGKYEARLFDQLRVAESDKELQALEEQISANGFYPYRCTPRRLKHLAQDEQAQRELFSQLILDSVRRWVQFAEKRLAGSETKCYIMAGNDDDPAVLDVLSDARSIVNPEGKKMMLPDGREIISLGYSNRTPFDSPRELGEEELWHRIAEMAIQLDSPETSIFNFHCPPYDCGLDVAPKLTHDLDIVTSGGRPVMIPVGSKAVRQAIEQYQPLLGLHGHVHESRGTTKIGRTLCINPGSEYAAGVLRGVIVDIDHDRVRHYQMVSG